MFVLNVDFDNRYASRNLRFILFLSTAFFILRFGTTINTCVWSCIPSAKTHIIFKALLPHDSLLLNTFSINNLLQSRSDFLKLIILQQNYWINMGRDYKKLLSLISCNYIVLQSHSHRRSFGVWSHYIYSQFSLSGSLASGWPKTSNTRIVLFKFWKIFI
jgi:hypothetical protein